MKKIVLIPLFLFLVASSLAYDYNLGKKFDGDTIVIDSSYYDGSADYECYCFGIYYYRYYNDKWNVEKTIEDCDWSCGDKGREIKIEVRREYTLPAFDDYQKDEWKDIQVVFWASDFTTTPKYVSYDNYMYYYTEPKVTGTMELTFIGMVLSIYTIFILALILILK